MALLPVILAGLFLPLFPMSMAFNWVLSRISNPWLRGGVFLVWPQLGLALLTLADVPVPGWVLAWAIVTAALYGLRALAMRDVGVWAGYIATSAWALLWIAGFADSDYASLVVSALGFSLPLLLLALLAGGLEHRFGAAYTGVYGGLAISLPRFSGVLVSVILALVATPLFPAFVTMLAMTLAIVPASPLAAVGLLGVWLLWSWAGIRLLQGLIVGSPESGAHADLSPAASWTYVLVIAALLAAGVVMVGQQL